MRRKEEVPSFSLQRFAFHLGLDSFHIVATRSLIDYAAIAKDVVRLFEIRPPNHFGGHSLVQMSSVAEENIRFNAVVTLLENSMDSRQAAVLAKKLVTVLKPIFGLGPDSHRHSAHYSHLQELVMDFLKK